MKKSSKIGIGIAIVVILGIYYYIALPVINPHSVDFWITLLVIIAILGLQRIIRQKLDRTQLKTDKRLGYLKKIFLVVLIVFVVGLLLSSRIINANRYHHLLKVEKGEFNKDIKELSFHQIPLLDRDTAIILGNRKMGSMVDMVSQYEVDDLYSQINYKGRPVRVSPLRYANFIKWFTNRNRGIPAYIKIDMTNQTTELVKLKEGMRYTPSEHFGRNIYRHLRFRYPTYIFDSLSFEINEEGTPYFVCPVKKFKVGLFGGETVGRVVLCNAVTGETTNYKIEDLPQWVDRAYAADLLVRRYDDYGTLKHGYWNSVLGQRDCLKTTNGYNYLAIDDDVWVYTGVTSVSGDQSNVGFVLMNQRTMETKFYEIEGATEESAMSSAEGQVQNLHYRATFPLLLNISGEPTYFIALKDDAGLVKKYAMVNVQKYQLVSIGDTVKECESMYNTMLFNNGVKKEEVKKEKTKTITGKIQQLDQIVIGGNTHVFILLEGQPMFYVVSVAEAVDVLRYHVGDEINLSYIEGKAYHTVKKIQSK